MANEKAASNTKLGILVVAGFLFLVFSLYMIGKNQNIFGSSILVLAKIENVNGLVPGNNVRFQGLEIGTVKSLEMENDTTIILSMLIRKSMKDFIKKNSKISVNTDGLMGNKIVQIHPQMGESKSIEEGDILYALDQVGTDEMLEKLSSTGEYLELTLINLAEITERLNTSEAIWEILADPNLALDLKGAVRELHVAGQNASEMAKAGKDIMKTFEAGDGIINNLFTDTLMNQSLEQSLENLNQTSADAVKVMESMNTLLENMKEGQGTAGLILSDTAFREQLIRTMENVEQSTFSLNQNMEAMKSNFLFRGYFKKQEKEQKKAEKEANKNKE